GNGIENKEEWGDIGNGVEAVHWCPSGMNSQPWRVFVVENAADTSKHIFHFFFKKFGAFYAENECGIAISNFRFVLEQSGRNGKLSILQKGDEHFPELVETDEGLTYAATWIET
ncbi:MAG: hypothetical protein EZS28_025892, partial [Streblomastix strix]